MKHDTRCPCSICIMEERKRVVGRIETARKKMPATRSVVELFQLAQGRDITLSSILYDEVVAELLPILKKKK